MRIVYRGRRGRCVSEPRGSGRQQPLFVRDGLDPDFSGTTAGVDVSSDVVRDAEDISHTSAL